jgi:hypothetical protein
MQAQAMADFLPFRRPMWMFFVIDVENGRQCTKLILESYPGLRFESARDIFWS